MTPEPGDRYSDAPMWSRIILSVIGGTWLGPKWEPQTARGRCVKSVARVAAGAALAVLLLAVLAAVVYAFVSALSS